jgi:hypothetical protein
MHKSIANPSQELEHRGFGRLENGAAASWAGSLFSPQS